MRWVEIRDRLGMRWVEIREIEMILAGLKYVSVEMGIINEI